MRHARNLRAPLTLALVLLCLPLLSPPVASAESTYRVVLCQAQAFLDPVSPIAHTHNPNLGTPGVEFAIHRLTGESAPGMTIENVSEGCAHPQRYGMNWFGARIHNYPYGWPNQYEDDDWRRGLSGGQGAGLKWTVSQEIGIRRVAWKAWNAGARFGPGRLRLRPGLVHGGGSVSLFNPANPPSGHFGAASLTSEPDPAQGFALVVECETDPRDRCEDSGHDLAVIRDIEFTLVDDASPRIQFQPGAFIEGQWSAGIQPLRVKITEQGSGLHSLKATIDGNPVAQRSYPCNTATYAGPGGGPIATEFVPCPTGDREEIFEIDTRQIPDGTHRLDICALDYATQDSTYGAGEPVCRGRLIRTDNTAPQPPSQAQVVASTIPRQSAPQDVTWPNPGQGDPGSAIRTATYEVRDGAGRQVIGPRSLATKGPPQVQADESEAANINHIPVLQTPRPAGEYELLLTLTDLAGHSSQTVVRRLSYACEDSGDTLDWQPQLAIGLSRTGRKRESAKGSLRLAQGRGSLLAGEIENPSAAAAPQTHLCLVSRLQDQTSIDRISAVQSDIQGRFNLKLPAGPSRQIQAIHRQGHRETYSDPAQINVKPKPVLRPKRRRIRAGQKLRFTGRIPGPNARGRGVIVQAKAGRSWLVFQRATTRKGGRYSFTYRPNAQGITRPTRFTIRSVIPRQPGYPYEAGASRRVRILIHPTRTRRP